MSKHSYQLVNPIIEGTFQDVYDAKNPMKAAREMWTNLTEHVIANVPRFMFTMRDISNGELHHFEVVEDRAKNKFTIDKMNLDIDKKDFSDFEKRIDEYGKSRDEKQQGGTRKRYDDEKDSSSSSSSSSTDIYPTIRRTSPVAMLHYNTRVYYTGVTPIYRSTLNPQIAAVVTPVFTPIFKPMLGTFVAIWP